MTDYPDDITMSKSALEMVTVANEYCFFLENAEGKTKKIILNFINSILPLIYLKGSLLPVVVVEYPEANEKYVTEEQWEIVFTMLRDKLGTDDEFWIIDPLYINETEPLKASIAENLADIYQDMKDMIFLYQKNTTAARENALAECKQLFASHWGYKIANIQSRLHHLIYDKEDNNLYENLDFPI